MWVMLGSPWSCQMERLHQVTAVWDPSGPPELFCQLSISTAAFLRHEHSFHGTPRSSPYLERHPAHTGHRSLGRTKDISARAFILA